MAPRTFVRVVLGLAITIIALFVSVAAWIDPFNLYHPLTRDRYLSAEVRLAKRALARAGEFDSYLLGCSMSEEFSMETLDRDYNTRFGNITVGSATSFEQLNMLRQLPAKRYNVLLMDVYFQGYGADLHETKAAGYPAMLYDNNHWNDVLIYMQFNTWMLQELYHAFYWNRYGIDKDPGGHHMDHRGYYGWEAIKTWEASDVRRQIHRAWEMQHRPLVLSTANVEAILQEAVPRFERILMYFPPVHGESLEARGITLPGPNREAYLAWRQGVIDLASRYPQVTLLDYQRDNAYTRKDANYWDFNHFRANLRQMILEDFYSYLNTGRLAHPDFGQVAVPLAGRSPESAK